MNNEMNNENLNEVEELKEVHTEETKTEETKSASSKKPNKVAKILIIIAVIQVIVGLAVGFYYVNNKNKKQNVSDPVDQVVETAGESVEETKEAKDPLLAKAKEMHKKNKELCGWMKIDGTVVDYPIMFTPNDPEKYLRLNFEENYSVAGLPFLDSDCKMDPESDNLIIYGHNMLDGSMFKTIMDYESEEHWKKHPVIKLATLEEEREYEVLSAFYDHVYYKSEDCFKFYQFIDAENEEAYNEAISYYKENAVYETGVTAEYGDRLITLVTCSSHHEYGRFVVVAREKTNN